MANLGSEVSQVFSFAERDRWDMARSAKLRAERIIGELLASDDLHGGKAEVETVRDILDDLFSKKRQFWIQKSEIEKYFLPFALRALSYQRSI